MRKKLYVNTDRYEIDDDGNVYTNSKGYWKKMCPITNPNNYLTLGLTDRNGIRKTYFIHRLVYTSFNDVGYEGDYDVHHIDYDKTNCKLSNLQRMSHSENVEDYFSTMNMHRIVLNCQNCGKELRGGIELCRDCFINKKRDISFNIPKESIVKVLIENNGNFVQSSKFFGMTDNALRKRCIRYGLSKKSSDWRNKNYLSSIKL